ncbi:MAG: hypothetical protein AAB547_02540 [Patescibacteria group bacterium]
MTEDAFERGKKNLAVEFDDLVTAQEYLEWKETVPAGVRRQVEAVIKGNKPLPGQTGLFLSDQFLHIFGEYVAQNKEIDLSRVDKRISNLLLPLERIATKGGYLNVFETLCNPDVSWNLKRKIYETQIKPALDWLIEKDLEKIAEESRQTLERNGKPDEEQKGKGKKDGIPSQSEKVKPGGDTQEKKEGEPVAALFSVSPFFGGYYKQLKFNHFDTSTLEWRKPENELSKAAAERYDTLGTRIIFGKIQGGIPLSIPLPYDWTIDPDSLVTDAPAGSAEVSRSQEGLWYLNIDNEGVYTYQIRACRKQTLGEDIKPRDARIDGALPTELKEKIEELQKNNFPRLRLKREIIKFIRSGLKYKTSDELNVYYQQKPAKAFDRIWQRKEANCYWANTLAARMLSEIDDQWAYISGFSVREKDEQGNAILHSGNGHGWLEVWDDVGRRAVRLDATPKGDPNVDEQQQEKDLEGETGEGDWGESEDELMPEERVKEKIKEMKGRKGNKEQGKMTFTDPEEARFAELAQCTPEQAREFMKALDRVREIKDARGIPISELLKLEWKKIVTERKIEMSEYHGPVRMDEGDVLVDPVSARIDIVSKEFNPTGFETLTKKKKLETEFGGIDIYFSFDLSESMNEADGASGRRKADVQRDVALLFADSLMQCSYISRKLGEASDVLPMKIMVTLASESGVVKLHLTDKWGPKEQWALYAALNQLASGGTPTHTTLQLIEKDFDLEIADLKKKKVPKEKLPLHYTVEISDGVPNDFDATEAMHTTLKSKGMAVRSYCIGGASASVDAAEPIASFSQLPEILSKDIIEKFTLLESVI